jgi:hypothetical protein
MDDRIAIGRFGREALEVKLHVLVHQLVLREQLRKSPELKVRG